MIDWSTFLVGVGAGAAIAFAAWAVTRYAGGNRSRAPPPAVTLPPPRMGTDPPGRFRTPTAPARPRVATDQVRLSERVLVYLARRGRLVEEGPVGQDHTQQAIAESLNATQSAISKVLRRLVQAGVIEEQRRHLREDGRRLKVYGLTRAGDVLAREVAVRLGVSLLPTPPPAFRAVGHPTPEADAWVRPAE